MAWGLKNHYGEEKIRQSDDGWEAVSERPHFSQRAREMGHPASPLSSFARAECLAQRRLPTRAELFGDFGIRHEQVESMKGATHDQEFRRDSGMDEPPRILHIFFDEQVDSTDADPGRR